MIEGTWDEELTKDEVIFKLEHGKASELKPYQIAPHIATLNFCPRCGSLDVFLANCETDETELILDFECRRCYRGFTMRLDSTGDT